MTPTMLESPEMGPPEGRDYLLMHHERATLPRA